MIPFSPPNIDIEVTSAVVDALNSGWITTGPKTKEFEREIEKVNVLQNFQLSLRNVI